MSRRTTLLSLAAWVPSVINNRPGPINFFLDGDQRARTGSFPRVLDSIRTTTIPRRSILTASILRAPSGQTVNRLTVKPWTAQCPVVAPPIPTRPPTFPRPVAPRHLLTVLLPAVPQKITLCPGGDFPPKRRGIPIHTFKNKNKSIDVRDGNFANGTPAQIYDCNRTAAQKWRLVKGDTVLQVHCKNCCLPAGNNPENDVALKIWTCYTGLAQQAWQSTDDDRLVLAGTATAHISREDRLGMGTSSRFGDVAGETRIRNRLWAKAWGRPPYSPLGPSSGGRNQPNVMRSLDHGDDDEKDGLERMAQPSNHLRDTKRKRCPTGTGQTFLCMRAIWSSYTREEMSQVKLTLRPPPNVDFVHGYPGIPPGGPDRPQAAVKGAIEVRVGPQGVKAKWVRIELRKVETLPGGGMANTFYDFVGPSPVNLWTSSDEYSLLRTQDFPFSIRIPESIPPSIMLDNRAGIQYELVASLCTKGKKGFLRKRKSVVVSTQAAIIIDKHELHATWPVYNQAESRQTVQDGCTLVADRSQTCFGPGDRISVIALFRSDTLDRGILRGFELTLRETTIFRAGPHSGKKNAGPQVKVVTISDSKLAINAPLYVGAEHHAELTCSVSPNHTTTSLNSARHIDVTYVLSVKAIVDQRPPVVLDLPVVISNWQRVVSQEAIRRIGPAPTLSLLPISPAQHSIQRADPAPRRSPPAAATLPLSKDTYGHGTPANAYSTLPTSTYSSPAIKAKADELGGHVYSSTRPAHTYSSSIGSNHQVDDFATRPSAPVAATVAAAAVGRRPGSAGGPAANRLTITNAQPSEIPQQETDIRQRTGSAPNNHPSLNNRGPWPSAQDEKQRLYEEAKAKVERVQGSVARVNTPPPQDSAPPALPAASQPRNGPWMTAEEEKLRLFNKAQAAVMKTQGPEYAPAASPSLHGRSDSDGGSSIKKAHNPAELYAQAMAARDQAITRQQPANTSPQRSPPKVPMPQYPTAEEEKAALKRYNEAKMAVDRVQNAGNADPAAEGSAGQGSAPIAYEHLYPEAKGATSSSAYAPAPVDDLPPPFENVPANLIPASALSEKERLRRAYEERDAAAMAQQKQNSPPGPNDSPPPFSQHAPAPTLAAPAPVNGTQGLSEKEILRRKFEAQDAAAAGRATPPQPPPRSNSVNSSGGTRSPPPGARSPRPTPAPPTSPGKILTAAEEKALLKARYAAEEARVKQQQQQPQAQEHLAGPSRPTSTAVHIQPRSPSSPPPPPPLMPRPPAEYIQETQEEDARVSMFASNGTIPAEDLLAHPLPLKPSANPGTPPLDMKPFSPFVAGFEHSIPPPPPLPPKPAGE
ncbi:hypothetical protein LshimejAT787_0200870 [Lyophyllum shimeji]|uniref:Ricin B lectin domain-containing protein n=1 Tax=Lyophyllum shimeji TaxID=47721 RepID=A0A9P3PEM5_LYOSH|nr:hypothetical protein LshimejAT787_0200870 [Lyophyllum shimeji]